MSYTLLLLSIAAPALAATTEDERAAAEFVLAGHRDSRERLRAGVVRGTGGRDFKSKRTGIDTNVEVKVFWAFDYDRGVLRFERVEPAVNPKSNSPWGGRFLRTPTCVAQCVARANTVSIRPPGTEPFGRILPFDVRAIGSLNLAELEGGSTFEDAFAPGGFLSKAPLAEFSQESDSVYRLGWDLADGQARRTMWFDSEFGYSPIRVEDSVYGDAKRRRPPANVIETSWRKEGDAFIPVAVQLQQYTGGAGGAEGATTSTAYSFQFVWESVNREIPGEVFDPEKLVDDVPKTMFVLDNRLGGQPILVKRTDVENATKKLEATKRTSAMVFIMLLNGGIFILLTIWLVARSRKRGA